MGESSAISPVSLGQPPPEPAWRLLPGFPPPPGFPVFPGMPGWQPSPTGTLPQFMHPPPPFSAAHRPPFMHMPHGIPLHDFTPRSFPPLGIIPPPPPQQPSHTFSQMAHSPPQQLQHGDQHPPSPMARPTSGRASTTFRRSAPTRAQSAGPMKPHHHGHSLSMSLQSNTDFFPTASAPFSRPSSSSSRKASSPKPFEPSKPSRQTLTRSNRPTDSLSRTSSLSASSPSFRERELSGRFSTSASPPLRPQSSSIRSANPSPHHRATATHSTRSRAGSAALTRRRAASAARHPHMIATPNTPMLSSAIGDDPLPQFNASLADDDHVKVAVRIRPLNQTESARGDACVLSVHSTDARQAVLTVPDVYGGTNQYMNGSGHTPTSASANTAVRSFPFHACIGPEANQADVLRLCGITQMLDAALDGYNATILAYGQTGSGKTYTMSGSEDAAAWQDFLDPGQSYPAFEDTTKTEPFHSIINNNNNNNTAYRNNVSRREHDGIVAQSLAYIFAQVEARNAALTASLMTPTVCAAALAEQPSLGSDDGASTRDGVDASTTHDAILASLHGDAAPAEASLGGCVPTLQGDGCRYAVATSYCEIYNEALYDLLRFDQRQLSIRWDPVRGFHAPDLHIQNCASLADAQDAVAEGLKHRRVGSHNLNLESSRSHSILTVYIEAMPQRPDAVDYGTPRMGKVVFVDLAGSERLKDSCSTGGALKETASINRSLFMLGKVISALSAGAKGALVPYRESKLTKLLMDGLGGSALSLMIACCSPSSSHFDETLSTLSYATRAKNIRNVPTVHVDPSQAAAAALKREIRLLRTENAYLREQLGLALQKDALAVSSTQTPLARPSEASHTPMVIVKQDDTTHSASPSPLPAQSIMLPVPGFEGAVAADVAAGSNHDNHANISDLTQRLADSQRLLTTMAMENSRLAAENERLRAGGMQVSTDYSGAVEEVEWLRSKLAKLEAQLLGASFNSDEKTKLNVEKESDAEHGNGVLWIDESMPDGFAKADGHECLQEESMPGGSDTSARAVQDGHDVSPSVGSI